MTGCPRCGLALAGGACPRCLLEAELPPARVGRLELGDVLGSGGMGTVFAGWDPQLDREVAIKVIDRGPTDRILREARALARLDHPHIVKIHDVGVHDGVPCLVMERLGESLAARLPVDAAEAARLAPLLADAVAHAHARGVVHGDLKPANVLFDAENRPKIVDFGLARLDVAGREQTGLLGGTLHYVAPEVLDGRAPDERSDVYALGVLLYTLFAGKPPVGAFEPLPDGLDAAIRPALAPDPARRPTAAALRDALAGHAAAPADPTAGLARAVALTATAATGVVGWTLLISLTPRLVDPAAIHPMSVVGPRTLPDGRVVSLARFETWPTLGAVAACALGALAFGLLWRHWQRAGLLAQRPDAPLPGCRATPIAGGLALAIYGLRLMLEAAGSTAAAYAPVLGPAAVLATFYFGWRAALEARRVGRRLRGAWPIMLGVTLALVPPVVDWAREVARWWPA